MSPGQVGGGGGVLGRPVSSASRSVYLIIQLQAFKRISREFRWPVVAHGISKTRIKFNLLHGVTRKEAKSG